MSIKYNPFVAHIGNFCKSATKKSPPKVGKRFCLN